jgi:hypothetical protein
VVLNKLSNGLSFNYRCSNEEPHRASLRLTMSGGKLAEEDKLWNTNIDHHDTSNSDDGNGGDGNGGDGNGGIEHDGGMEQKESNKATTTKKRSFHVPFGALSLAALTMQEGGSLGGLTRTQVELFCVDQLIMVEIRSHDEFVEFNLNFPTVKVSCVVSCLCVITKNMWF